MTKPLALHLLGARSREKRQAVELGDVLWVHVLELLAVQVEHGLVELGEQVEAGFGDLDHDDAPVVFNSAAFGKVGFDQTIDQTGDVGDGGDELFADGLAGGAGRGVPAEDAEGVVGGVREAVLAEEAIELGFQGAGGSQDVQIRFLLGSVEGVLFSDFFAQGPEGHTKT